MRRPAQLQTGCVSATLAGSDVGIVTREMRTDGGRSVVVVLALEKSNGDGISRTTITTAAPMP